MSENLKRPADFQLAFRSKPDDGGVASIYVPAFTREHIPFLLKAIQTADDILALDEPLPTPEKDSGDGHG